MAKRKFEKGDRVVLKSEKLRRMFANVQMVKRITGVGTVAGYERGLVMVNWKSRSATKRSKKNSGRVPAADLKKVRK